MVGVPETRYVTVGDAEVAYQVVGSRTPDLVYFFGLGSHIDLTWDYALNAEFFEGLSRFSRLILFDRRGTGASDRVPLGGIPTWEEWAEDLAAVMDAARSSSATIIAEVDSAPIALLFTAMHPERVNSLVLVNTSARYLEAEDYQIGVPQSQIDDLISVLGELWGTPELIRFATPAIARDEEWLRIATRMARAAVTPRNAAAQYRYLMESLDVRAVLPMIKVPTLVLHTRGNDIVPIAQGRYLADHIPGARFVELPGEGLAWTYEEMHTVLEEVGELVTGERPEVQIDRVLTTVMFTDVVGSTLHAARVGDRQWRMTLDAHDRAIRDQLRRYRGHEIMTMGDGFHASFDGPASATRCAQAITDAVHDLGLEVRAGLHTGECEIRNNALAGIAVHIAARVGAIARPREVLVSSTVKDLVAGSGIEFTPRGRHRLKGVPGSWELFAAKA